MLKAFKDKLLETLISILPMVGILTIIFLITYFNSSYFGGLNSNGEAIPLIALDTYLPFLICSFTLVIGSALFQLGADNALSKVGSEIGSHITKKGSIILLVLITTALGILISIAEPDLTVFGDIIGPQINTTVGTWIVKLVAGVGVGVFLSVGLLRIIYQKSIKFVFLFGYVLIFAIACLFGPKDGQAFLSIAYDTSGVTTGPATVPFVIAFGAAVASARGGKDIASDSFGLSGIMSLGPVITMLALCLIVKPDASIDKIEVLSWQEQINNGIFLEMIGEVFLGVGPLLLFFLIYNFVFLKLNKKSLFNILLGFAYTIVGLYIFLLSASLGFKGLGLELGENIASNASIEGGNKLMLYLFPALGLLTGIIIVLGEPSIAILTTQVEEISGGVIKKKAMIVTLALGVGGAIALELCRNVFWGGFPSYYLFVPIYLIAIILMFLVPDIYSSIAFDSGGIASGTISVCFVLPLVIGMFRSLYPHTASHAADYNGFGIIGMVSALPIVCVEALGVVAKIKGSILQKQARQRVYEYDDVQIIHFEDVVE